MNNKRRILQERKSFVATLNSVSRTILSFSVLVFPLEKIGHDLFVVLQKKKRITPQRYTKRCSDTFLSKFRPMSTRGLIDDRQFFNEHALNHSCNTLTGESFNDWIY